MIVEKVKRTNQRVINVYGSDCRSFRVFSEVNQIMNERVKGKLLRSDLAKSFRFDGQNVPLY